MFDERCIFGGGTQRPVRPTVADALYGLIEARTASGHSIKAVCRVIATNKTKMELSSTLPPAEFEIVTDEVQAALTTEKKRGDQQ